jgi:hypothetical protein
LSTVAYEPETFFIGFDIRGKAREYPWTNLHKSAQSWPDFAVSLVPIRPIGISQAVETKTLSFAQEASRRLAPWLLYQWNIKSIGGAFDETITSHHV